MRNGAQKGSMTVETAMLFPLLFLLTLAVLYTMFSLYASFLTRTACHRAALRSTQYAYREDGWPEASEAMTQQLLEKSGLSLTASPMCLERQQTILYSKNRTASEISLSLWGNRTWRAEQMTYHLPNASARCAMELLWEIGERLPGIGSLIQEFQGTMREWKSGLGT